MFSKRTFIIALLLLAVFVILLSAGAVWAAYGLEETAKTAKLPMDKDVPTLIGNVIGAILSLVGVFFFGLMIYGGFLWMTAHGNAETEKKALATIMAAIIGIIIILASYAITSFVFKEIQGEGETPPKSQCAAKGEGYDCRDKSKDECDDSTIKTGLCPGGNNIVCCKAASGGVTECGDSSVLECMNQNIGSGCVPAIGQLGTCEIAAGSDCICKPN